MPAIIRLARHGKKGQAFYHIVVADSRYPRDGRFIEKIGTYNPRTNPVSVELKFEQALSWIQQGAKPSDTVRTLFSERGVLIKAHLLKGVKKGVLTQEQAEAKFSKWVSEKEAKVQGSKSGAEAHRKEQQKKRTATETSSREARAAKRASKQKAAEAAAAPAATETVPPTEEQPQA